MISSIYWVTDHLATSARPRGGDWLQDEVHGWRQAQVANVISLLEDEEARELDLVPEGEIVRASGLQFWSLPVVDRGVPSAPMDFWRLAARVVRDAQDGQKTLIHCRQGIGRASLMAVAVLVRAEPDLDVDAALNRITEARGRPVPDTEAQRAWLVTQADLNRGREFDLT